MTTCMSFSRTNMILHSVAAVKFASIPYIPAHLHHEDISIVAIQQKTRPSPSIVQYCIIPKAIPATFRVIAEKGNGMKIN